MVVYKIDWLTRSLMDFAKLVEVFDRKAVTFISITQSFNTTNSMRRLTLNMLLSFAQFEREVNLEFPPPFLHSHHIGRDIEVSGINVKR